MTDSEKKFYRRLAIIWAIVTSIVTLFFAYAIPESAPIVIIVGIFSYLAVFVILRVFQWLLND
jgi:hypothetical protein